MVLPNNQVEHKNQEDDEACLVALQLTSASMVVDVLIAAFQLDVFEIIAKAGNGAHLSSAEIVSHLPTHNPDAPVILDRLLCLLASHSVLSCTLCTLENGQVQKRYGLTSIGKFFVKGDDGVSTVASLLLLFQQDAMTKSRSYLKDAVLEGILPFNKTCGMTTFDQQGTDPRFNNHFNTAMSAHTSLVMKKVLEVYKGFEGLNSLVDVAGGVGIALKMIISKYPTIKGSNFDLPHVIKEAPKYPGIENISGDMFVKIPSADAIFMKWILHNWTDERCLILLKNCYEALPESGKMIVVESILPMKPETSIAAKEAFEQDNIMLAHSPGGKERNQEEFEALAKGAGFAAVQVVSRACNCWVIEFLKCCPSN